MGRPKKYQTEEERKLANRKSKKKWAKKNKSTVDHIRAKSFAKKYVMLSQPQDIKFLEKLIQNRKNLIYND